MDLAADLSCGLYYKPMMIINEDSKVVTKLETSLTDDARFVIYNCHMFIVQATGEFWKIPTNFQTLLLIWSNLLNFCKAVYFYIEETFFCKTTQLN